MVLKQISLRLWREKPLLRSTDDYIAAANTARYLHNKSRLLIVGDAGGRDWRYLSRLGKELHLVDLAAQEGFPNLYVQSIEQKTPFPEKFFDGVVLNEVIEHLFLDVAALGEIRRVLKDDGVLVITLPYFLNAQDRPEQHVRIHSPNTIRRLLEGCGFEIEEQFCRGFCTRLPQLSVITRSILYLSFKLVELLTRQEPDRSVDTVNGFLNRLERFFGSHPVTIRFQRLFASYGGVMKVRKSIFIDFYEIQRSEYTNSDRFMGK